MIDIDKYEETDHHELVEFEGETLGDTLTNLITEVYRLREEKDILRGMRRKGIDTSAHDKLLSEIRRLTKTLELIGKNMPYDSWMHTLIKDVIGYEKWQAKEMIE